MGEREVSTAPGLSIRELLAARDALAAYDDPNPRQFIIPETPALLRAIKNFRKYQRAFVRRSTRQRRLRRLDRMTRRLYRQAKRNPAIVMWQTPWMPEVSPPTS